MQEEFIEYFHNMISERSGLECHLFDASFVFLSEMKVMLCMLRHACHREAGRTLRREWFSRQLDKNTYVLILIGVVYAIDLDAY